MSKLCIFCCSSSKLSKEHIYPKWMKKHLPVIAQDHSSHHVSFMGGPITKGKNHRPGDFHSRQLRVVCEACNNGWMSALQTEAKPHLIKLINNDFSGIDSAACKTLAKWAFMLDVVHQECHPETIGVHQLERTYFYHFQDIPANWYIFMGRTDFGVYYPGHINHHGGPTISARPPHNIIDLNSVTGFTVNKCLFFNVKMGTLTKKSNINWPIFLDHYDLKQIYPQQTSTVAIPKKENTWEEFYEITNSIPEMAGARVFVRKHTFFKRALNKLYFFIKPIKTYIFCCFARFC